MKFIRDDTGEVIDVSFADSIRQDAMGYILLPDGGRARRFIETSLVTRVDDRRDSNKPHPPSDALGFTVHQLADMEHDRKQHGFGGIEFKPDPAMPQFYQVHFPGGSSERQRYIEHRGYTDRNRHSGVPISAAQLEGARALVARRFSEAA